MTAPRWNPGPTGIGSRILRRYVPVAVGLLAAGGGAFAGLNSIPTRPELAVERHPTTRSPSQPSPTPTTSPPTTSADTTTSEAQSTTRVPETTTTLPATTTTEPPSTSAKAVVQDFYSAINSRDFLRAWDLGGKNLSNNYEGWKAGYANTLYVYLSSISSAGNTVYVSIESTQTSGEVERYRGTYTVRGGAIVSANVIRSLAHNPYS